MQRKAVKSAMRTFEVLELFAEQRRPLSLHEIYTSLGYPQSSTTNLLKSMVLMGYLNYSRGKRTYQPTMKLNVVGGWVAGYLHSQGGFRELVDELQRRTDETVGLCTQNDLFLQYFFLKPPEHEFKNVPPDGTMRLLVDSAGGLAMMSRMSNRAIDNLCRYTNHYEMGSERISTEKVMKEIEWIRRVGYCHAPKHPTPDVSTICIALDADLHGIPLAIGVGGLASRIDRRKIEIVQIMRELISEYAARHAADHPPFDAPPVGDDEAHHQIAVSASR